MASTRPPPEVADVHLLKNKNLPKTAVSWDNNQLPIDILLLTVKDCEFLSCLSYLNPGFHKSYHQNLGYVYFGDIGENEDLKLKIAVMKCSEGSTGPGGSVIVVKNAVAALRPKAVFSVGCCGSLDSLKAKRGDVIVSAKLITYAPTNVTENGIQELGHSVPPKRNLANLIRSAGEGWEPPLQNPGELDVAVYRDGVFLSGPEKVQSEKRCKELIKRFPEAVAIETEGEGLHTAAHDLEIEWIIIKAISEYANKDLNSEVKHWRLFASVMAASLTAEILSDPIVFQKWPHYESEYAQHLPRDQSDRAPSTRPRVPTANGRVKTGSPSEDELEDLSMLLADNWEKLGRRLGFERAQITAFHKQNEKLSEKAYEMLMDWKQKKGSDGTYQILYDALCHRFVGCKRIAEEICCDLGQEL